MISPSEEHPAAVPLPARAAVDDEDDDDAPRKGKGESKKGLPIPLIIGGVAALLLVGGGVAAYALLSGGKSDTAQNTTTPANQTQPQPALTPRGAQSET